MRENTPLSQILFGKAIGGGGGGSVTPASIVTATGQMTSAQAATTRGNLGAEPEKFVVNLEVIWGNVNTVVSDKTFSEIYAAYNSGKMICAIADEIETKTLFVSNSMCAFMDTTPPLFDGRCFYHLFMVDDQNNWTAYEYEIALSPSVVYSTNTSATIQPENNKRYEFANSLTSLEIVAPDNDGISYSIIFTSGSTPTTTTIPSTILGLESFAAEANTIYEINVLDNRAVVGSWGVSA